MMDLELYKNKLSYPNEEYYTRYRVSIINNETNLIDGNIIVSSQNLHVWRDYLLNFVKENVEPRCKEAYLTYSTIDYLFGKRLESRFYNNMRYKIKSSNNWKYIYHYTISLEKLSELEDSYYEKLKQYNKETREIHSKFKEDLISLNKLKDNPKVDLLYSKAWELGHSSGLYSVKNWFEQMMPLIK